MPAHFIQVQKAAKFIRPSDAAEEVRINYIETIPQDRPGPWPVILLIHGFPLTSHQFTRVLGPFAEAGFRSIAPDYTGAGGSSKPEHGYSKTAIAADLHELITKHFGIKQKIHVVSHDIGAMIGHAYASQYPEQVASVTLGECPLPGTSTFEEDKGDIGHFHVNFHAHTDLAVSLVSGREELYLRYFFDKQAYNTAAITDEDVAIFVKAYSQPGALRAAFLTYKDFSKDLEDNKKNIQQRGLCKVPALAMGGTRSHHAGRAEPMLKQLYQSVIAAEVEEAGHYIAMENSKAFVREILTFVKRHV
ncbi:microsomal epoxide hydrolase [Myriangium duriaei CBS 260.36]|uniref:Microsomal epoxide hydrolase n=1 Tax=Myriangium duriaei CBS 260.36 TaxID=1168546 RepID=A0A9P4ML62_9PEZI|nr:microsomal epoxide hydrolase [Myriangium duriaei CBS 260.36]